MNKEINLSTSEETLRNFMKEFFDFKELKKIGFYSKDIKKTDYQKQADKVCYFFGYKTVYEYGANEIRCHISYAGKRPKDEPLVTVVKSIYD